MAYVRTRTTKAGSVSTTLVESYRDETGRHGNASSPTCTASRTRCARWPSWRQYTTCYRSSERKNTPSPARRGAGFVLVTERALTEHNHRMAKSTASWPPSSGNWRSSTSTAPQRRSIPGGRATLQTRILRGFRAGHGACHGAQASRRRATANGQVNIWSRSNHRKASSTVRPIAVQQPGENQKHHAMS